MVISFSLTPDSESISLTIFTRSASPQGMISFRVSPHKRHSGTHLVTHTGRSCAYDGGPNATSDTRSHIRHRSLRRNQGEAPRGRNSRRKEMDDRRCACSLTTCRYGRPTNSGKYRFTPLAPAPPMSIPESLKADGGSDRYRGRARRWRCGTVRAINRWKNLQKYTKVDEEGQFAF
jgi:hypothetical protein